MTSIIKFRRGKVSELPESAPSGIPLWCEDTGDLYIGVGEGIKKVNVDPIDLVPVSTVLYFAKETPPEKYLICNGGAISRTAYATLFKEIGTTYGEGDGSTTFNLPLLTDGRFVKGNTELGILQDSNIASHNHSYSGTTSSNGNHTHSYTCPNTSSMPRGDDRTGCVSYVYAANTTESGDHTHTFSGTTANSGSGNETYPKNLTLLPCIKYC